MSEEHFPTQVQSQSLGAKCSTKLGLQTPPPAHPNFYFRKLPSFLYVTLQFQKVCGRNGALYISKKHLLSLPEYVRKFNLFILRTEAKLAIVFTYFWPRLLFVRHLRWRLQCMAGHSYYQRSVFLSFSFSFPSFAFDPLRGKLSRLKFHFP